MPMNLPDTDTWNSMTRAQKKAWTQANVNSYRPRTVTPRNSKEYAALTPEEKRQFRINRLNQAGRAGKQEIPIGTPPPPPKQETSTPTAPTEPVDDDNYDEPIDDGGGRPRTPGSGAIRRRITERRRDRPTNYKIHVLTALGMAFTIRFIALGKKSIGL